MPAPAAWSGPPRAHPSNPATIQRIGTDHVEVSIRAVSARTEVVAVVDRLERLIAAGYDRIDVIFEAPPDGAPTSRDHP